jgi:alkyl hydroperoxide reductase subunit AhpC
VELERELEVAYTKVVAISVDPPATVLEAKNTLKAHFPILSDETRQWQRKLDLVEYTDAKNVPYIPYSFLLEPGLIIYKIYCGYWFWGRPTLEDVRQDFRAISMKWRPDWDPQAGGVKEVWEEAKKKGQWLNSAEFRRRIQAKRGG